MIHTEPLPWKDQPPSHRNSIISLCLTWVATKRAERALKSKVKFMGYFELCQAASFNQKQRELIFADRTAASLNFLLKGRTRILSPECTREIDKLTAKFGKIADAPQSSARRRDWAVPRPNIRSLIVSLLTWEYFFPNRKKKEIETKPPPPKKTPAPLARRVLSALEIVDTVGSKHQLYIW